MTNKTSKKTVKSIASKKESELETALKSFGYLFPETDEEIDAFEEMHGNTEVVLPEHLENWNSLKRKNNNKGKVINLNPVEEEQNSVIAYAAREGQNSLPDFIKEKMTSDKKAAVEKLNKSKAAKKKR